MATELELHPKVYLPKIRKFANQGIGKAQLAVRLDISRPTLDNWFARGREDIDDGKQNSVFAKAWKMWSEGEQYAMSQKRIQDNKDVLDKLLQDAKQDIFVTETEEYDPSTNTWVPKYRKIQKGKGNFEAQKLFLMNNHPDFKQESGPNTQITITQIGVKSAEPISLDDWEKDAQEHFVEVNGELSPPPPDER